jgi:hypothetical protein
VLRIVYWLASSAVGLSATCVPAFPPEIVESLLYRPPLLKNLVASPRSRPAYVCLHSRPLEKYEAQKRKLELTLNSRIRRET